jgi:hypothetical protein
MDTGLSLGTWIRTDYAFYQHRAVLRIDPMTLLHTPAWHALFTRGIPADIAAALTRLVTRAEDGRYDGAVVVGLAYDIFTHGWQISILHPTFDELAPFERAPEIHLAVTVAEVQAAVTPQPVTRGGHLWTPSNC